MLARLIRSIPKFQPAIFFWLLAILLPIFAVLPALTQPIEEHAYDTAEFHIYRAVIFSAARADGSFYPRWVQSLNAGLGGPFFSIYPPMIYFLMDLLYNFGLPHPLAWRVLVACAFIMGSAGMFGLGRLLFRRAEIALVAATIFAYSTVLIRDLFERGAPAGMSLALFPATLWLMVSFAERPNGWRLLCGSLFFALAILIHSQTSFLLAPLVLILVLYLFVQFGFKRAARSIFPLIGGGLLAACYWLPFPFEVKYVQFENANQIDYANPVINSLPLPDLFALPSRFDAGIDNNVIPEAAGVWLYGLIAMFGLMLAVILLRQNKRAPSLLVAGASLLSVAMIWMQLDAATPVWSLFSALSVFLFRWRLLIVLPVTSGIIVGFALAQLAKQFRCRIIGPGIAGYLLLQAILLYPQLFFHYATFSPAPTVDEAQASAIRHNAYGYSSFDEFLPTARNLPFTPAEFAHVQASPIANLPAGAKIIRGARHNDWLQVTIETPIPFVAAWHTLYYPGWAGFVDGVAQNLGSQDQTGYITFQIPAGTHNILLKYEGTSLQHVGDVITVLASIALALLAIFWRAHNPADVPIEYAQPRWSVIVLILVIAGTKALVIDPQTTLLRDTSTCSAIAGNVVQTNIVFGDGIRLCGYELAQTDFRVGDRLSIMLYWQLEHGAPTPANAFVHLLGTTMNPATENFLWGQQDKSMPGQHELALWQAGVLYRDQYSFRVSPGAPPGNYQLEIGWWRSSDNQRLRPRLINAPPAWSISSIDSLLFSPIRVR